MANYYTQKSKAAKTVRILFNHGKTIEEIEYEILMDHGFGSRFVRDVIFKILTDKEIKEKIQKEIEKQLEEENGEEQIVSPPRDSKADRRSKKKA